MGRNKASLFLNKLGLLLSYRIFSGFCSTEGGSHAMRFFAIVNTFSMLMQLNGEGGKSFLERGARKKNSTE